MAPPLDIIHSVVILPNADVLQRDSAQCGFTFSARPTGTLTTLDSVFQSINAALTAFFNAPSTVGTPLAGAISQSVPRTANAISIKHYRIGSGDLVTPGSHGAAAAVTRFTLGGASTSQKLPQEVACCLSYRSTYGGAQEAGPGAVRPTSEAAQDMGAPLTYTPLSTHPRAQLRGRTYLGPLNNSIVDNADVSDARVQQNFMDHVVQSGADLMANLDLIWQQWSRVQGGVRKVVECHVDNAFDIQRRRGVKATVRSVANPTGG
jgi:hypothetical protein